MNLTSEQVLLISAALVFVHGLVNITVNFLIAHLARRAARRELVIKTALELAKTSNAPLNHHADKVIEIIDRPKLRRIK